MHPEHVLTHAELMVAAGRWAMTRARARGVAMEVRIGMGQEDVVALLPGHKVLVIEVKTSWSDYQKEWSKPKWRSLLDHHMPWAKDGDHYFMFFAQAGLAGRISKDIRDRGLRIGVVSHPRHAHDRSWLVNVASSQVLIPRKATSFYYLNRFAAHAETRLLRRQSWQVLTMLGER